MTKSKVIDQQHSVYSEVKMVGMTQIERKGDDFVATLLLRYPPEERYNRHTTVYRSKWSDASKWCNEQLQEENLKRIYELEELTKTAMAEFYSPQNRSKYDYNE